MVDVAKVELLPFERGQGRGPREPRYRQPRRWHRQLAMRYWAGRGGARPRTPRWCGRFAQRRQVFEPMEPARRAVRDFAGNPEPDKPVEQPGGVVGRDTERLPECGGRDERGRGQNVDCRAGMRIAAPAGNRASRGKPMAFEPCQQRQPVLGFAGDGGEEMSDPLVARPRYVGAECRGTGQQRAGQGSQPAPVNRQRRANRRPLAAPIEPSMHREGGAEQRRMRIADGLEMVCRERCAINRARFDLWHTSELIYIPKKSTCTHA
jgi:hypothetical protein